MEVSTVRDQGTEETALTDKADLRQRCRHDGPDSFLHSPWLRRAFSGLGKS